MSRLLSNLTCSDRNLYHSHTSVNVLQVLFPDSCANHKTLKSQSALVVVVCIRVTLQKGDATMLKEVNSISLQIEIVYQTGIKLLEG